MLYLLALLAFSACTPADIMIEEQAATQIVNDVIEYEHGR